ncbi:MAG TPA: hypothetical protein VIV40_36580 [Kofleriaceae bacterium]
MVRLGTLAIALSLAACSGEIQSDIFDNLNPKDQVALEKWVDKAYPVLGTKCLMCHDGSMPMIGYLAGASDIEKRDTLIAYMPAVINLSAPQSSRMLTKGAHTGPALEAKEASDILSWIIAEREARMGMVTALRSDKLTPMLCTTAPCPINTIDLASLGQPGTLTFEATALSADLYLTTIKIQAGAAGLHITHPLFESWPAGATDPKPDPIDRWFNVDLQIAPNTAAQIGTGEGSFTGFNGADQLSMRFDVFEMKTM